MVYTSEYWCLSVGGIGMRGWQQRTSQQGASTIECHAFRPPLIHIFLDNFWKIALERVCGTASDTDETVDGELHYYFLF